MRRLSTHVTHTPPITVLYVFPYCAALARDEEIERKLPVNRYFLSLLCSSVHTVLFCF
jgi:hypothetical protein